jgi:hypothetical protein
MHRRVRRRLRPNAGHFGVRRSESFGTMPRGF